MVINSETTLQNLLISAKRIADDAAEIRRLKGEDFNIFSILRMETAENATHSAFIGELLNPQGSHGMGNKFLRLFLEKIGYESDLGSAKAAVVLEKHVGFRKDNPNSSGRIDIYISFDDQRTISIENKWNGADGNSQIVRYVNHNHGKNTVYFLTKYGREASDKSRKNLNRDEGHYHCISYQQTIVDWLAECIKESADFPILRESIKQYMILIRKKTGQLTDSTMEHKLKDLITQNYEAADLIAENIKKIELNAAYDFMSHVKTKIQAQLRGEDNWIIYLSKDLSEAYSGLTIRREDWDWVMIKFGGESRIVRGACIYGIVAPKKDRHDRDTIKRNLASVEALKSGFKENIWWAYYQIFDLFTSVENRARLFDGATMDALANEYADKIVALAEACKDRLAGIPRLPKA